MKATDRAATAFHEAGHAWAYVSRGYRLRYVTLRPRTPGTLGRTVSGQRLWRSQHDYVLAAGPVAETEFYARSGLLASCTWDDALWECLYIDGGVNDRDQMLSTTFVVPGPGLDGLRTSLAADWENITRLTEELLSASTVPGALAEEILRTGRRPLGPLSHPDASRPSTPS